MRARHDERWHRLLVEVVKLSEAGLLVKSPDISHAIREIVGIELREPERSQIIHSAMSSMHKRLGLHIAYRLSSKQKKQLETAAAISQQAFIDELRSQHNLEQIWATELESYIKDVEALL